MNGISLEDKLKKHLLMQLELIYMRKPEWWVSSTEEEKTNAYNNISNLLKIFSLEMDIGMHIQGHHRKSNRRIKGEIINIIDDTYIVKSTGTTGGVPAGEIVILSDDDIDN